MHKFHNYTELYRDRNKYEPLHCPKEPLIILLHFFHLSYQPFTSLYIAIHIYMSLPLTSIPFNFYRLHFPSIFFTFLTLVFKMCVLTLAVPIAPSGSLFQSVIDWSVQVRFLIESVRALNCVCLSCLAICSFTVGFMHWTWTLCWW